MTASTAMAAVRIAIVIMVASLMSALTMTKVIKEATFSAATMVTAKTQGTMMTACDIIL